MQHAVVPYHGCNSGYEAVVEIEIPFNAPPDRPTRIFIDDGRDVFGEEFGRKRFQFATNILCRRCVFAAIREGGEVPVPLE